MEREGTVSGETRQKTRILLADGHHMVRQGIRQLLEREPDFEVVGEADNGMEAVRLAHEFKPDMIIMEARMPRLDAVEVIKRLKTGEQPEAVLILTTYEDEDQTVELLKAGANGCIFKTAPSNELAQAIRMVRAGQFVCDPLVEKKLLKHAVRSSPVALDFGEHLTRREAEVLKLAAKGLSNRDIATYLALTEGTVKGYFVRIFSKMSVSSRTEAVTEAVKRGWVSLEDK
jgi:DNA-binding NarL/FixJ family response regulator